MYDAPFDEHGAYNKQLLTWLAHYAFTEEEYAVLQSIGGSETMGGIISATMWLRTRDRGDDLHTLKEQVFMLRREFWELPLYINDSSKVMRWMALWRLKIGR